MIKALFSESKPLEEATATAGNPSTFETDVKKPLKQCKVNFTQVQSGSGDPSPDNVRTITGWTGVNIYHSGEDETNYDTHQITWTSLDTVYRGYIDASTGTLVATWKMIDMGSLVYTIKPTYGEHIFSAPVENKKNGNSNLISSQYKVEDAAISNLGNNGIRGYSSNNNIWLRNDSYSSENDLKTAMEGVQLLFELAEPITVGTISATSIKTLIGENNVWSNADGNLEIKFMRKATS